MGDRRRPEPSKLKLFAAVDRYLRRRAPDATEKSLYGWRYRLKRFVEWAEGIGIEVVGDLRKGDVDEFYELRSANIAPATLEGEMWTLKMFLGFLEDIGAVEEGLADAVRIPDLDPDDRTNETKLRTEAALALLRYYRNDDRAFGTRAHVFFELAWITGARVGGLRALDLQDVHLEDRYVMFRHRPETGTPLKNKSGGERPVGLPPRTVEGLKEYLRKYRHTVTDENGRAPLLASTQGRPGTNTMRNWSYESTLPCHHSACPHEKSRDTCKWTNYHQTSKCPSSRSPHQIRTGTITWLLNLGWPPEDVAERVNATVKTIEQHYDQADPSERRRRLIDRMEDRRRPLVEDIDTHIPDNE